MRQSSGPRLRAVVDTNLFVSGTMNPAGQPRALLRAWTDGRFHLLLSEQNYVEAVTVLRRPQIVARYRLTAAEIVELFAGLAAAPRVEPSPTIPLDVRDPKDEKILAAAFGGQADYLITGDEDLLVLAGDPRIGTLKIVTVAQFLAILDAEVRGAAVDAETANGEEEDADTET